MRITQTLPVVVVLAVLTCSTAMAQSSLWGDGYADDADGTNLPDWEGPSTLDRPSVAGTGWGSVASRLRDARFGPAPRWLTDRARDERDLDRETIVVYEPRYRYYDPAPRVRYYRPWGPPPPPRFYGGTTMRFGIGWGRYGEPSWRLGIGGPSNLWPHPWYW